MLTIAATSGTAVPRHPISYDPEELFIIADAAPYAAEQNARCTMTFDENLD